MPLGRRCVCVCLLHAEHRHTDWCFICGGQCVCRGNWCSGCVWWYLVASFVHLASLVLLPLSSAKTATVVHMGRGLRLPPHLLPRALPCSGLPVRRKVTERYSGPCWNCSTNWTASAPTMISRCIFTHTPTCQANQIMPLCVRETVCGVLQVIAATNRVDILDPALLRSGQGHSLATRIN